MGTQDTTSHAVECENSAYGKYFKMLPSNDQIRELQTILRDR